METSDYLQVCTTPGVNALLYTSNLRCPLWPPHHVLSRCVFISKKFPRLLAEREIIANALLYTVKIIPPPCAQGLDFMPKACVFCDEISDTCHKFTNNYRNLDVFPENNRENNHKDNE